MALKFITNIGKLIKSTIKEAKELIIKKQSKSSKAPKTRKFVQPVEKEPKVVVKLKRFNRKLQAKGKALKNQEDQFNLK